MVQVTSAAYLGITLLCIVGAWNAQHASSNPYLRRHRIFWLSLAAFFFLLFINKQFQILSWFTALGRGLAWGQGWHTDRQIVQQWIILVIFATVSVLLLLIFWSVRDTLRNYWLILIGAGLLLGFTLIRAISFHAIDAFLFEPHAGIQLNWIVELTLIVFVAGAIIASIRSWKTVN
jgi:hypothetical protein